MMNQEQIATEHAYIETFLKELQDYTPPIPEPVIKHLLAEGGMSTTDSRVSLVMNIATQKFISEVIESAAKEARERIARESPEYSQKKKMDLQVSDIKPYLQSRQMPIYRPEYLVSLPTEQHN